MPVEEIKKQEPSKEIINMHDLLSQAAFWESRGNTGLQVSILYTLEGYCSNFRDSLVKKDEKKEEKNNEQS